MGPLKVYRVKGFTWLGWWEIEALLCPHGLGIKKKKAHSKTPQVKSGQANALLSCISIPHQNVHQNTVSSVMAFKSSNML